MSSSRLPIEALFTFKQLFRDQLKANLVTSLDAGEYTRASARVAEEIKKSFERQINRPGKC